MYTELLPGNVLIKYATILLKKQGVLVSNASEGHIRLDIRSVVHEY
jgi:hypothetical protein